MPNFDKLKFTNKGYELQTQAQAGNVLKFSKIKMGSGIHSGDASNLSDLVNPILEASIITGSLSNKTYTVETSFSNVGMQAGFYWNEIGLFAQDSKGNDVLYAYASASGNTDYIPSESESSYLKRVKIAVVVGNATNIEFVQGEGVYVDTLTFNEKIAEIKTDLSNIQKELNSFATNEELENAVSVINESIESIESTISSLSKELERINANVLGDASISHIGTGTVTGAIVELYRLINLIPSITSGTTEPTGGEDGDVYIMYEE